jgi:hypothetical protein
VVVRAQGHLQVELLLLPLRGCGRCGKRVALSKPCRVARLDSHPAARLPWRGQHPSTPHRHPSIKLVVKGAAAMRHPHRHQVPNAPSRPIWVISLILGLLGVLMQYRVIVLPTLQPHTFLIEFVAFLLLAIGTTFRGI